MTCFPNLIIEPLTKAHNRSVFRCGINALDRYLSHQAGQDIKRRISRVFVATAPNSPQKIVGFYTLSTLSIELTQLPEKIARKLPKHPIPAALIGRLAVEASAHGNGIGKRLLADAIKRTLSVSDQIAIYAMVVDAINEDAEAFYKKFGFLKLCDDHSKYFLPLKSILDVTLD